MNRIVSVWDGISSGDIDFGPIAESMKECEFLSACPEPLMRSSFDSGLSVVLIDSNQAAKGHIRMWPWLDNSVISSLGLVKECPELWELGSSYIDPGLKGHFTLMREKLLFARKDALNLGSLVTIGMTNVPSAITTMKVNQITLNGSGCNIGYRAFDASSRNLLPLCISLGITRRAVVLDASLEDQSQWNSLPNGLVDDVNLFFSDSNCQRFTCPPNYLSSDKLRLNGVVSIVSNLECALKVERCLVARFSDEASLRRHVLTYEASVK